MKMSKQTRYKVISAVSTTLIMALLYALLNYQFMPFSSVAPIKTDEEEMEIPLEQIMEDLAELAPLPNEKIKSEEIKPKPVIETKLTETSSENSENEFTEPMEKLPPIKLEKIVVKDEPLDSMMPAEILKILQEQQLVITKTDTKEKTKPKYQYQSAADKYKFYQKNYKAIRNFLVAYPYALRTRKLIDSLNIQLAKTPSKAEQKKMINETEKQLFSQYEAAIRKMTTTQGRILLKMIARETNKSGYQLIKEFKGGFSATFWYAVGKLFSTDLKTEYHKENEDSIYEEIIERYDAGEFK